MPARRLARFAHPIGETPSPRRRQARLPSSSSPASYRHLFSSPCAAGALASASCLYVSAIYLAKRQQHLSLVPSALALIIVAPCRNNGNMPRPQLLRIVAANGLLLWGPRDKCLQRAWHGRLRRRRGAHHQALGDGVISSSARMASISREVS